MLGMVANPAYPQVEIQTGNGVDCIGLPHMGVVLHKGVLLINVVAGSTGNHGEEFRGVEGKHKLKVAEDLTPEKSCLYRATPTPIM